MFGRHQIQIGTELGWRFGPMDLLVSRIQGEMRIASRQVRPADSKLTDRVNPAHWADELSTFNSDRFSFVNADESALYIYPRTAPKRLVIRLREPVILTPDSQTSVYVSTPTWLAFSTTNPEEYFHEIPSLQLQQTWFGASNQQGELCLSCTNKGTIHPALVEYHPARAITRVHVVHRGVRPFTLEKLKIPMRHLAVYEDTHGHLHTDGLRVLSEQEHVQINIDKGLRIDGAEHATLVSKARKRLQSSLERALHAILG